MSRSDGPNPPDRSGHEVVAGAGGPGREAEPAALWERFRDGELTGPQRRAFEQWLGQEPGAAEAFEAESHLLESLAEPDADLEADGPTFAQRTLDRWQAPRRHDQPPSAATAVVARLPWRWLGVAACVGLIGLTIVMTLKPPPPTGPAAGPSQTGVTPPGMGEPRTSPLTVIVADLNQVAVPSRTLGGGLERTSQLWNLDNALAQLQPSARRLVGTGSEPRWLAGAADGLGGFDIEQFGRWLWPPAGPAEAEPDGGLQ